MLGDDEEFEGVLRKRDLRHGLVEPDMKADSDDDEPQAKRQRVIEEPQDSQQASGISESPSPGLFAPSDMRDS